MASVTSRGISYPHGRTQLPATKKGRLNTVTLEIYFGNPATRQSPGMSYD